MTFIDHLTELRKRLFRVVIAVIAGAVVGLYYSKELFHILQIPMLKALPKGGSFIATTPFESYVTYFKVALLAGMFLATPVIFYQIWRFITPALTSKEKRLVLPFSIASALLFTIGALFGYFVVFPTGFYYVNLILEDTSILLMPRMEDYFSVAVSLLLGFGVSFELPIFIYLLGRIGIIDYSHIRKFRRHVIVVIFIVAGVLTPGPDVLSQVLLAIPLCILYELGGLTLLLHKKLEAADEAKEEEDA